ncbi:tRNA epoxyqueuosine(34) reductase QueG [Vulcanibacillus modesticaldus]|uniref:tRNA epoxyqueuosine(34) reductase QueG n=1 Tax=Vulcanibacillus modesticaldus TaxID=337097 RepID=A0A1D2YSL5_9BACI|nr:tRNA epoxyqueuosine(34) reductase QueG [Vulcanibacillus modesticaldus]OEF97787.1 tRNA epoxyqueuosine(34) reductase QueG [Vulcanibacillus modesticaldus]
MSIEVKEKLIDFANKIGIDKIGFTSADPFWELKDILIRHRELGYESGFEERDIDKRVDPKLTMKDAKSIIAIAIAYPTKISEPLKSSKGMYRGFVARSAWGIDYHLILREKMKVLGEYLKSLVPDAKYVYMTDTGVLSDHAVAQRAGIGWIGKNSLLITPEYGSYVYLGEIITNVELPSDTPLKEQCGECNRCLTTCPTKAIVSPKQVNSKKCLSYLTQTKVFLDERWMEKLGNRLFGCDTCQQVCPKNKGINYTHHEQTLPEPELAKPLLKPLLTIKNKEFKNTWGKSAASWRGKKPIQRNAIIGLAHFKDVTALPQLIQLLMEDNRSTIRQTAAWAIGRIGGNKAKEGLQMAKNKENDTKVLQEIVKSLKMLSNQEILDSQKSE